MTENSASVPDSPEHLLAAVRDLARKVRVAQRGTWFPLLVFAAITLLAIPVERYVPPSQCRAVDDGLICAGPNLGVLVYWPVALVVAYAAIAAFYIRQARRRGVGTRIGPYVVVGAIMAVVLAFASVWRGLHPFMPPNGDGMPPHTVLFGLASPGVAMALALLVLAWVERYPALLAFGLGFLVIMLVQSNQVIRSSSPWHFLPQLLVPAVVLLLGSAAFYHVRPTIPQDA